MLQDRLLLDLNAVAGSKTDQVVSIIEQDFERAALVASRTQLRWSLIDFENDKNHSTQHRNTMIKIIQDARNSVPAIQNIDILSLQGKVIASTNSDIIGHDKSDKDWFQHGLQSKYQDRFHRKSDTVKYALVLPLVHPGAEMSSVIGVVRVHIALERLMSILTDYTGLGETGEIVLVAKEKDEIVAMNPLRDNQEAVLNPLQESNSPLQAMHNAIQGRSGVLREPDYRGMDTLNAYRSVPINQKQWGLVIKIDTAEIFEPIAGLRRYIYIIGGILIFCVFVAVSTLSNRILLPIKHLQAGTQRIGKGELNYRLDVQSQDEIGKLTSSFNDMAENLQRVTASRDELKREIFKRKQAEIALQKSEKNLYITLQSIGDGVITTNKEGRITRMNPVAEQLTGWTLKEAESKMFNEVFCIVNAHTGQTAENPVQKVIKTGKIEGLANDTTLIARDGTQYQIADSAAPIRDDEENIYGVVMVFSDVTEQYKLQQEMMEQKRLNEMLLSSLPHPAMLIRGKDKAILAANQTALDMGVKVGGQCWREFGKAAYISRKDKERIKGYSKTELVPEELEIRCTFCKGNECLQEAPVQNEPELVVFDRVWDTYWIQVNNDVYLHYVLDITERKKNEQKLAMQNTLLKTQQEASIDGILIVDESDKITSFNQRFADIWKIPDDIMDLQSGEKALRYVLPMLHDPEKFAERINELYKNRQKKSYDEILLKDGRVLERYSAPIIGNNEHYYGRIWYYRDITERKKVEQKLTGYAMELEEAKHELDKEIHKAKRIHEKTLQKHIPEIEGLDLYAYYQPAAEMGGDFYNFIQVGDNFMFYISDITGHGLDAAMMSSFVRNSISCYVNQLPEETILNPAEVLRFLAKQYAQENYPEDYFITVLLGVIDLKKNTLTYSSAGIHIPPLLVVDDGELTELPAGNMPISAVIPKEHLHFQNEEVELSAGATLFISTDGLTEQEAEGEVYGHRHYTILQEKSHLPPQVIADLINEDFQKFNGKTVGDDDITYSIIQTADDEKHPELELEIASCMEAVEPVKEEVQEFISPYMEDTDTVMMAFHELLINAMEHGNQFDPKKKVYIHCELKERYLLVSVSDEGDGFDWRKAVAGRIELSDIQDEVEETGRGLGFLVTQAAADYFYYYFNGKGNKATFIKLRY